MSFVWCLRLQSRRVATWADIQKTMTISQHPLTLYKTHFGDGKSTIRKHSHSSYHGSDVLLRAEKTLFVTKLSTSYICEAIFRIRAWERGAESCKMYTHKNHIMLRETYSGSPLGPLFCTISQSSTGWIYCWDLRPAPPWRSPPCSEGHDLSSPWSKGGQIDPKFWQNRYQRC